MAVLAVLIGGLLITPSGAAAADQDPKAPSSDSLTEKNAGDVSVEKKGSRVTVEADVENAYLYVFPADGDPVSVGWLDFAEGKAGVDLALMPAGEVTIALLDADGSVVGWATTELTEAESNAPAAEDSDSGFGAVWLWIVVGLAVVLVAGAWWLRRRNSGGRAREPAEEEAIGS